MPGPWILGGLLVAGMACTDPTADVTDGAQQAVLSGDLSGPEDDGVVMVRTERFSMVWHCSGSLIAPNLLLTARHCISYFVDDDFSCTPDGELDPDSLGGQIGEPAAPDKISVGVGLGPGPPPVTHGLETFLVDTSSICRNDIAVVLLADAVQDVPVLPVRLGRATSPSEKVRVVGYGQDEFGGFATRRTRSGLTIAEVGTSQFRPEGDSVPARTFVTRGPALCGGDSGGPALSERNAVVGIFSQVTGDCTASTARDYYTEVAPFESQLLRPAFAASGFEPLLEAAPNAGAAGAAGAGAGHAGNPGVAAAGSAGSAANGTAGAISSAGTPSSAGTASDQPSAAGTAGAQPGPEYRGPRKKGGCTCRAAGGPSSNAAACWLALLGLVLSSPRFTSSSGRRARPAHSSNRARGARSCHDRAAWRTDPGSMP